MGLNNSELCLLVESRVLSQKAGGEVVKCVFDRHTIDTGTAEQLRRVLQGRADLVAVDGEYHSRDDPCDVYEVVVPRHDTDPMCS